MLGFEVFNPVQLVGLVRAGKNALVGNLKDFSENHYSLWQCCPNPVSAVPSGTAMSTPMAFRTETFNPSRIAIVRVMQMHPTFPPWSSLTAILTGFGIGQLSRPSKKFKNRIATRFPFNIDIFRPLFGDFLYPSHQIVASPLSGLAKSSTRTSPPVASWIRRAVAKDNPRVPAKNRLITGWEIPTFSAHAEGDRFSFSMYSFKIALMGITYHVEY